MISLIVFCAFSLHPLKAEAGSDLFLIPDGTIIYQEDVFWRSEAASSDDGIEWVMDYKIIEEMVITSLSDSIVKFEKEYTISVNDAYQKRDSITYDASHYGFIFLDDDYYELSAKNSSSLTFSLTRNVNKQTGERVLAQNPYGATHVILLAFYDFSELYEVTLDFAVSFGDVGSLTNIFDVNATDWQIGDIIYDNFTVSGENVIKGYETWVLELNTIPEGYSEYSSVSEYEKTSGLYVKSTILASKTDELHYERSHQILDLTGVIDDGYPVVSAPSGQIVDSLAPTVIIFQGSDTHFDHYNLYRNQTLFETNDVSRTDWSFSLTPTSGNTSWTFEIVDSLGYSTNATTWLLYEAPINATPGFNVYLAILAIAFVTVPLVKRRR